MSALHFELDRLWRRWLRLFVSV